MKFKWDEKKNAYNIRQHHIDFNDAVKAFSGPMAVDIDDRSDYGEERLIVFVEINNETAKIISARRALKHKRKIFEETIKN